MSRNASTGRRGRSGATGAWLVALALIAAGCAQTAPLNPTQAPAGAGAAGPEAGTGADQGKPALANFTDLPIPQGAKMNVDKTLVVGTQTWFGQLMLETSHSADSMFEFYARELGNYGWQRIAAVRAPTSVLTYDRENRVLSIAIQPARVYGSEITITVSPREEPTPAAGRSGPAMMPGGGPTMPPPVRQVR